MKQLLTVLALLTCAGCLMEAPQVQQPVQKRATTVYKTELREFKQVVARVEPVAERICRQHAPRSDCDLQITVDKRKGQAANAYQTVDKSGRPMIVFTLALLEDAHNDDEIAFILGHEAAHHIEGHLSRSSDSALAGAVLGGVLATLAGADAESVDIAWDLGGAVGARTFSKNYELEADALGTIISYRAGFDPLNGVAYFNRIPNPGNQFLGTHPPNGQRIKTVRKTMANLR